MHRPEIAIEVPVEGQQVVEIRSDARTEFIPLKLVRDPFLDGSGGSKASTPRPSGSTMLTQPRAKATPPAVAASTEWPQITYHGLVRNTDEIDRRVGFLNINGKFRMLSTGAISDGLTVLQLRQDSAVLAMGNLERSFARK
nr:hypothetical protein [Bacteroidota bacterium]